MAMNRQMHIRRAVAGSSRAFTLLEIAICIAIVGVGITALMGFMGSATRVNRVNTETALAVQYARGGWELAASKGFGTVSTWTANPPTSAPALMTFNSGLYERRVWAENLDIDNVAGAALGGVPTDKLRLNVEIRKSGVPVYSQKWILTNP